MNKITFIIALLTCLAFWACETKPVGGTIENTYWKLESVKEGNKKVVLNAETDVSAILIVAVFD